MGIEHVRADGLVSRVAELEARLAEQLARQERASRLGAWVEQQLAKLESAAATKASLKASSAQRRAPTPSTSTTP
jgi:pyridoxine/pyridoxamine 5'-phosphate oxidase